MQKSVLKFVPSQSRHYLHCPYFLKLSNVVKIPIDDPHIVGIRRAQLFKDEIVALLSRRKGTSIIKAERPLDIILNRGLMLMAKKLDIELFSTDEVSMVIEMFKPDLIETTQAGETIEVKVKSIKNTHELKEHHYLQAMVYKLVLEKALKGTTMKKYNVESSIIYWDLNRVPRHEVDEKDDIEGFSDLLSTLSEQDFYCEININSELSSCLGSLQKIATLDPQTDDKKCDSCVGRLCCDVYNHIDFKDRYDWFDKFNDSKGNSIKEEKRSFTGIRFTPPVSKQHPGIIKGDGFIMIKNR